MKLLYKLLAPVVLLTTTTLALLWLSLWFGENARSDQGRIVATEEQILQVAEVRALSRALQRDTLNLIFDPDPAEKTAIAGSVQRRTTEMTRRLDAVVSVAVGEELADLKEIKTLQAEVLVSLAAVQKLAAAGDAKGAHALFRDELRKKERAASRATDGFMEARVKASTAMKENAEQARKDAVMLQSLLGLSSIAVAGGVALAIVLLGVIRPLATATNALTALSQGRLDIVVPEQKSRDEIGELVGALRVFRDNAEALKRLEEEQAAAAAQAMEDRRQERRGIAQAFEASVSLATTEVAAAAREILRSANNMAMRQGDGTSGALDVASAADDMNMRLSTVGAAVEELSASIGEITEQASRSSTIAREGVEDVAKAGDQIKRLEQASREIAQVVGLINEIAAQTSLLALNATIEAARAGDAGKGFAVVANEVKQLSNQTTAATEGIARQVAAIQSEASQTASAVQRIHTSIGGIADNASSIAAAVEEQRATTDEINRTLSGLSGTMGGVSRRIVNIGSGVIQSCAGAIEVLWVAEKLEATSDNLSTDASKFLQGITA